MADQYFSRAVEKAMLALDSIRRSPQPLSLMEVSSLLALTKASTFRLLYTLEALNYLSKSSDGRYSVPSHEMVVHGSEPLERLAMEFGETASIAALFDNHIGVLAVVESSQIMRMGNTPGRILPPHASSLGKAVAAFQLPEITERLVRSYGTHYFTAHTIIDEIALRDEFTRIRQQGFAEDVQESIVGGRCFAAPILGSTGRAIGAVSLSMPLLRFGGEEHRQTVLASVRDTASIIQNRL
jgi:DNA-binding IclR family transcriptional regulator